MRKLLISLLYFLTCNYANADNIYIDQTLSTECTTGGYSITSRDCSGSAGNAYDDIQTGIDNMSVGDHLILRGGTYTTDHIAIPTSLNGSSWDDGDYNYIGSYPGEWAVIDGNGDVKTNGYSVIGLRGVGYYDFELNYWMLERLEITGGGSPDHEYAYGFFGNKGPFIVRGCYIHDNYVRDGSAGSVFANGGISGYMWHDSIIEYCYFDDNGVLDQTTHNIGHINIASDYNYANIRVNGFTPDGTNHRMRNSIRYNLFDCSRTTHAYKDKAGQYFTGRAPGTRNDTYNTYGLEIDHNIVIGLMSGDTGAFEVTTDFSQIYNNIIDASGGGYGFFIGETTAYDMYKIVAYNNTIIEPQYSAIWHHYAEWDEGQLPDYWSYDYNNLIYQATADNASINDISIYTPSWEVEDGLDLSNYVAARNYSYDPDGTTEQQNDIFRINSVSYTAGEFLATWGFTNWMNDYDSGDPLFVGTTGADKYKVNSGHIISGSYTPANAGIGGSHPYLSGVTLPSYIGAANPSDDDWVAGVLSLESTTFLAALSDSDPAWIEGSTSSTTRYYLDADGDGYSPGDYQDAESDPGETWYTEAELTSIFLVDCDDSNTAINPGATEVCGNEVDDNCNGQTDEGCATTMTTIGNVIIQRVIFE